MARITIELPDEWATIDKNFMPLYEGIEFIVGTHLEEEMDSGTAYIEAVRPLIPLGELDSRDIEI